MSLWRCVLGAQAQRRHGQVDTVGTQPWCRLASPTQWGLGLPVCGHLWCLRPLRREAGRAGSGSVPAHPPLFWEKASLPVGSPQEKGGKACWSLLEAGQYAAGHPVSQLPRGARRQGCPSQRAEDTEPRRGGDSPGPTGPRASSQASCSTQGSIDSALGREVEVFPLLRASQPE